MTGHICTVCAWFYLGTKFSEAEVYDINKGDEALKNKFVCPFGLKIGRVGRSIPGGQYFFFFF